MIIVHHLERSRSHRILWLLEELNLKYEIKEYKRDSVTMLAPEELKKVHPLGKSPVITDGDKTIAESSVIVEYILDKYGDGKLRPQKDTNEYYQYLYFLHGAEGSYMPYLFLSFVMSRLSKPPVPFFVRPISKLLEVALNQKLIGPNLKAQFKYIDNTLEKTTWLAGNDFTAADVQMSYPIQAAATRSDLSDYPHMKKFIETIKARPAYQKAVEIGGPVEL